MEISRARLIDLHLVMRAALGSRHQIDRVVFFPLI
jgi:hypothetical protein